MLYLWGNCQSLSLCSPNLFYILLWPLVLSRPLRQLLWKSGGGGGRRVHIDQDLHVYCPGGDLFFIFYLFFTPCGISFSVSRSAAPAEPPRPRVFSQSLGVFSNIAAADCAVVNAECIELKVTGCERVAHWESSCYTPRLVRQ